MIMAGPEGEERQSFMIITEAANGTFIYAEFSTVTAPDEIRVEDLTWTREMPDGTSERITPFDMTNDELVRVFENLYGSNVPEYILHSNAIRNNPARVLRQEYEDRGVPTRVVRGTDGVRTEIFGRLDQASGRLERASPEIDEREPVLGTHRVFIEVAPNDFVIVEAQVGQEEGGYTCEGVRFFRGNEFASRDITVSDLSTEEMFAVFRGLYHSEIPREILQYDPSRRPAHRIGENPAGIIADEFSFERSRVLATVRAPDSNLRAEIFGALSLTRGEVFSPTVSYYRGDRLLRDGLNERNADGTLVVTPDEVRGLIRQMEEAGRDGTISEEVMWGRIRPLAGMLHDYSDWADARRTREPYAIIEVPPAEGRPDSERVELHIYVVPSSLRRSTMSVHRDDGTICPRALGDLNIAQLGSLAQALERSQIPSRFTGDPMRYVVAELQERGVDQLPGSEMRIARR